MKSRTEKDKSKAFKDRQKAWDSVFSAYREGTDTLEMWRELAECQEAYAILNKMAVDEFLDERRRGQGKGARVGNKD